MEASLSMNIYVLSEDGVEGLELIIQYHVGVLSEGGVVGLQLIIQYHVGLSKGFLQSLLAFCPPPIKRERPMYCLYEMEVGILPTELCWHLFVKLMW